MPALLVLGVAAAAVGLVRLVHRHSDRWFDDIASMDEDYPRESHGTSWPAGGTGSAGTG